MTATPAAQVQWVAVDWGTTRLRAWVMGPNGAIVATAQSNDGMGTLAPSAFEDALLALIGGYLPRDRVTAVICCGMAGARQGWVEATYIDVPCRASAADGAVAAPTRDRRLDVRILPGVRQDDPADVMRGEETQIAGFLVRNPGFSGVVCLPGTHTKWARIESGAIAEFRTFMTGELFSLLSSHSVLKHAVATDGDDAAFKHAVAHALAQPWTVSADLFSIRAMGLLQGRGHEQMRSRLSGLLIGLELAGARPFWADGNVVLLGADTVSRVYESGLAVGGAVARRVDADAATLAGLTTAYETMEGNEA